jgi:hypothetical protein
MSVAGLSGEASLAVEAERGASDVRVPTASAEGSLGRWWAAVAEVKLENASERIRT